MMTLPGRSLLDAETHARQLGLAVVRAFESGDKYRIVERSYWFHRTLRHIAEVLGDHLLAIDVREHVKARVRAAQRRAPIVVTVEVVPASRRRLTSEAGSWDCL